MWTKIKRTIPLLFIIGISLFTHLYRLGETYNFHNDEGRDVLIALRMLETGKPVLLGPQTSVGNMYLGPLYYYLMAPALWLSGLDPIGPAIMVALLGVVTTVLLYQTGRRWFKERGGIVAALFFALTPIMVHFTRSSWNPNVVPVVALAMLMCLDWIEAKTEKRQRLGYLAFGLAAGVLFQLHYVAMTLPGLLGLYLLWRRQVSWSGLWLILLGFGLTSSPFWLFEARHHFVNIVAFVRFVTSGSHGVVGDTYLARLVRNGVGVIADLMGSRPLTYNHTSWLFGLSALIALLLALRTPHARRLGYLVGGTVVVTAFLHEPIYAHYLAFLFPVLALLIGAAFGTKSRVQLGYLLIFTVSYLWISIPTLWTNLRGESSHQTEKAAAVTAYIQQNAAGAPYNVVAAFDNARETTYLYYLQKSGEPPSSSAQKLLYIICEDRPCVQSDADNPGIYNRGPAHPSLEAWLGHPFQVVSSTPKVMESSTHTVYGVWVARVIVTE
jgi:4-amino-4-deoxy-L-arabinose transferase-like glycosyltransferase